MKPKHTWDRKPNGTYSNLRHYWNRKKRLARLRIKRDGFIYIVVNNRQKMAGKPMRRKRQMDIVWHRLYKKYCRRRRKK